MRSTTLVLFALLAVGMVMGGGGDGFFPSDFDAPSASVDDLVATVDSEDDMEHIANNSADLEDEDEDESDEEDEDDEDDDDALEKKQEKAAEAAAVVAKNAWDRCNAELDCKKQEQINLSSAIAAIESKRASCEATNKGKFSEAVDTYKKCLAVGKKACADQMKKCKETNAKEASDAKGSGIKIELAVCAICIPKPCTLQFKEKKCERKMVLSKKTDCAQSCENLCPTQSKCEKANSKEISYYRGGLAKQNQLVIRCQRSNRLAVDLATKYSNECSKRNEGLLNKCAETSRKAEALQKKTATAAGFPASSYCPTVDCDVPVVKHSNCAFPVPPAPKLASCIGVCSEASCYDRAKCEQSNEQLLRRISRYERKYHQCLAENKNRELARDSKVRSCAQQQLFHNTKCQMLVAAAIMDFHTGVQKCMEDNKTSDWSKCLQAKYVKPTCPPFKCDESKTTLSTKTAEELAPVDCDTVVPKDNMQSTLKNCEKLCANTLYSKWRGEKSFRKYLDNFKKSKIYTTYKLYLQHRAECNSDECRADLKKTWRRVIISCPVGEEGNGCRKLRKFKAAVILRKIELMKKYEKDISKCKSGDAGQLCRRLLTRETRRMMRVCPPKQSKKLCAQYKRYREVKILQKCGPVDITPKCRRVRRRCVSRFSAMTRANCLDDDAKCKETTWQFVQKSCYMQ